MSLKSQIVRSVTESSEEAGRGIRKEENREEERLHSGNKLEIYHMLSIHFVSELSSVLLFWGISPVLPLLNSPV